MQFSHRYKPGVITPKLLQINIAQLSWESWILLLQADLMCQSYEPLFLTENNSSLFITSLVKPLLKSLSPSEVTGGIDTNAASPPWHGQVYVHILALPPLPALHTGCILKTKA